MFKGFKQWSTTGWLGNVTSGAIGGVAGSILFAIAAFVWDKFSPDTFRAAARIIWGFIKTVFTYQVSILYAFLFIAFWYVSDFLVRRYKPKKGVEEDDVWKKVIGNYTFGDLRDILLQEFLSYNKTIGSLVDNGLVNFYKYAAKFVEGLNSTTLTDGGFAYTELAPYLGLHRLVDKRGDTYFLNDNGHLLYSSLATTFKDYPDYKARVYAIQLTFGVLPPGVLYTGQQADTFVDPLQLNDIQIKAPVKPFKGK